MFHVVANGSRSTVEVFVDGASVLRTTTAELDRAVRRVQLGNDRSGIFDVIVDDVAVSW